MAYIKYSNAITNGIVNLDYAVLFYDKNSIFNKYFWQSPLFKCIIKETAVILMF